MFVDPKEQEIASEVEQEIASLLYKYGVARDNVFYSKGIKNLKKDQSPPHTSQKEKNYSKEEQHQNLENLDYIRDKDMYEENQNIINSDISQKEEQEIPSVVTEQQEFILNMSFNKVLLSFKDIIGTNVMLGIVGLNNIDCCYFPIPPQHLENIKNRNEIQDLVNAGIIKIIDYTRLKKVIDADKKGILKQRVIDKIHLTRGSVHDLISQRLAIEQTDVEETVDQKYGLSSLFEMLKKM